MNHSEQIAQLRLTSDYVQMRAMRTREINRPLAQMPTYGGRDAKTGIRSWGGADGSKSYGRYLSNSRPQDAVLILGSLGRDGVAIQKPAG
jgi:hypothetical protein